MTHYQWSIRAVGGGPAAQFAHRLEEALNELEAEEFEVDDILDAPDGRQAGVIVIGKKPRRFPVARSSEP